MQQITAPALRERLDDASQAAPLLLDVREPHEYAFCHIEGSLNIPMNTVPARIGELDPDRETVVICHHGMRSASIAGFLGSRDFQKVFNLSGGVEAWAVLVDPAMPRY